MLGDENRFAFKKLSQKGFNILSTTVKVIRVKSEVFLACQRKYPSIMK